MKSKITRREFISRTMWGSASASIFAASGSMLSCSAPIKTSDSYRNILLSGDKPLLIILRGKNLDKMLEKGLKILLESGKNNIKKEKLFIKPNATCNEPYPVTTDPLLLSTLIRFFKEYGSKEITIGDNPSYRGILVKKIFKERNYYNLKKEYGVKVLPRDPGISFTYRKVTNPKWKANPIIMVNKDILSADLVINTAIPKRHHEADFTCALKNNFGSIYDPIRTHAHIKMEIDKESGQKFFDRTIAECADAARPQINIIDARALLIKSGPGFYAGGVVQNDVNELIISGDMVAVDTYCAELMKKYDSSFDSEKRVKNQLNYAQSLGLGKADLLKVEVIEMEL